MKKLMIAISACLALLAGTAQAHGPSRLKSEQSVLLNASPEEVWAVIGSFSDMTWLPSVTSITATGAEKGATRVRVLDSGVSINEELLKIDPAKFAISTRLTEDNLDYIKATNYALHITIKDEGGKARVELKSAFYRAFPQNDPPADLNDDASTAAVEALGQQMIEALVARFGAAG
ncbi:SRPBCC family protein [Gemmobacter sp. 24YEA27]|uniref:SRPBCC family protein n=1 Tax=Gemmobacter sp. 24YEA27 TaxID=3040672 RepID=UPI0024B37B48|nr:SRPBCC family protein [Gemmobacter sp. 24YEA27]